MENRQLCPKCGGIGVVYHVEKITDGYRGEVDACPVCRGTGSVPVAITNGDRIRAMSNEKLAILLCRMMDCSICKRNIQKDGECDNYSADGLSKAVLNWLQRPAEEDT